VILVLDLGLLVVGLWDIFMDTTQLGAPSGQSPWTALAVTLGANLVNTLRHLWAIHWVILASGALGTFAALARRTAPWVRRVWGRALSFLAILAVLSFSCNALLLLWRESQAEMVVMDRVVYYWRQLESDPYWQSLVLGTVVSLFAALLFWEAWRGLCRALGSWVGLFQPLRATAPHQKAVLHPTVGEYTARLIGLKREAHPGRWTEHALSEAPSIPRRTQEPAGAGGMAVKAAVEPHLHDLKWVGGLLLLCLLAWPLLHSAYTYHVPSTGSQIVYLYANAQEKVERVRIRVFPHAIVFASSVGHGLFNAALLSSSQAITPIREVRDFRLEETAQGSYRYARMSIEGLDPGNYYLRMSLRPAGDLRPDTLTMLEHGDGIVSYSLHQGGGLTYRLIAVGMATVLTVGLLLVVILLIEGVYYLRTR
jgi:hypothetical protein